MQDSEFNHGIGDNPYNRHSWVLGDPQIGKNVWIGAFTLIDALHNELEIGEGTDVSSGVQILTHSTVKRAISERRYIGIESAPTKIGNFCFLGTHATILMGVEIGDHSVIAAGSVVPQFMKIPPYSMVAGVPAKIIGSSKKLLKDIPDDSLSITIPAFNEDKTIETVVKEVIQEVSKLFKDYEILLVNDGSTDKTGKIIDLLAKKNKHIKVIHHKTNKGFTGAMKSCLFNAQKNLVLLAPADGQFNFKELYKFTEAIKGYDMVIGYKKESNEGFYRKFSSKLIYTLYQKLFDVSIREISTVFMWRKNVIDSIKIESADRGSMFLYEFFYKAIKNKFKYVEIPISWHKRRGGQAKGRNLKNIIKTLEGMIRLKLHFLLN